MECSLRNTCCGENAPSMSALPGVEQALFYVQESSPLSSLDFLPWKAVFLFRGCVLELLSAHSILG